MEPPTPPLTPAALRAKVTGDGFLVSSPETEKGQVFSGTMDLIQASGLFQVREKVSVDAIITRHVFCLRGCDGWDYGAGSSQVTSGPDLQHKNATWSAKEET